MTSWSQQVEHLLLDNTNALAFYFPLMVKPLNGGIERIFYKPKPLWDYFDFEQD